MVSNLLLIEKESGLPPAKEPSRRKPGKTVTRVE